MGRIPDPSGDQLAHHLEECGRCVHTIRTLAPRDTLLEAVQQAGAAAQQSPEEAVTRLIERLHKLSVPPAIPEIACSDRDSQPAPSSASLTDDLQPILGPSQGPGEIGRLGGYRVLKLLGTGGMGVVFQAEDTRLQRPVALKVMKPVLAASASARQRFLREARATAALSHERVVAIYQVGEDRGIPFLAMECLQGETLNERIKREGRLPAAEVLRIGREIAEGLSVGHERGLIHRDIKEGNIFLEVVRGGAVKDDNAPGTPYPAPRTRVKILDFGLVRAVADDALLTQSGAVLGTPAYMAPEQADGQAVDARSDLFSLGCILYHLATGRLPFRGTGTTSLLLAVATQQPAPPCQLHPEVPPALSTLIMQLLEKKPAGRPASAAAVVARIREIEVEVERQAERKREKQGVTPIRPAKHRWLPLAAVAAAFGIGIILGGALVTWKTKKGTLTVEVMEADVKVLIDGEDKLVLDSKKVGQVELIPGVHRVTVKRGEEELYTKSFALKRGGEVVLSARWEARAAKQPSAAKSPRARAKGITPRFDEAWFRVVGSLRAEVQVEVVKDDLKKRNPGFDGQVQAVIQDGAVTGLSFSPDQVTDLTPVRVFAGLKRLACTGTKQGKLTDLSPLKGMAIEILQLSGNQIKDLTPLRGMPALRVLHLTDNPLTDLAPLAQLPLRELLIDCTRVRDLSPLKGVRLKLLHIAVTPVRDLSPLKGMPLEWLAFYHTGQRDFRHPVNYAPLKDLPLREVDIEFVPERDTKLLRSIKSLEIINGQPVAEVWKKVDAEQEAFAQWSAVVRPMSPDKQVETVAARLKERNPGFDGKLTPTQENGVVTGIVLVSDHIMDVSPLRALAGLRALGCAGSEPGKGKLANLWPLAGLALTRLDVANNPGLSDLTPLRRMPLKELGCDFHVERDSGILRSVKTLEKINGKPAAEVLPTAGQRGQ